MQIMGMRINKALFFLILICLSVSGAAGPCDLDAKALCDGILFGNGRIGQCLRMHKEQVSGACEHVGLDLRAKRKALKTACYGDVVRFCGQVVPGMGRVMQCLRANDNTISANCRSELNGLGEWKQ
jgi:hypothetical protein